MPEQPLLPISEQDFLRLNRHAGKVDLKRLRLRTGQKISAKQARAWCNVTGEPWPNGVIIPTKSGRGTVIQYDGTYYAFFDPQLRRRTRR